MTAGEFIRHILRIPEPDSIRRNRPSQPLTTSETIARIDPRFFPGASGSGFSYPGPGAHTDFFPLLPEDTLSGK